MKLSALIELYKIYLSAAGRSQITIDGYLSRFNRWLAYFSPDTQLASLTPEQLDNWAASLRQAQPLWENHNYRKTVTKALTPHSIYGYIQSVKTLLKWAFERGYTQINLGQHLQKPRLNHSSHDKVMNREDLYRLLDAARDNSRDFAILAFLVDTGCRRGEAATLKISSTNLDKLEATVTGKTGQHIVVYTSQAAAALVAWMDDRPVVEHDYMFTALPHPLVSNPGEPIKPGAISSMFQRLKKRAGIKRRVSPHMIRHLVGQSYTDNTNLALAKEKLNHASIVTTGMIYSHQDNTRVHAATDLYSPLNDYMPTEAIDQLFKREDENVNSD